MGEELLGPTLLAFGTPEQQQRFLPPIRAGAELWCQGYSEPDAGSDLASVATRAALDGDEWVHQRPEGLDLAGPRGRLVLRAGPHRRRRPARHRGLSYLLVPMDQPGITVRPIRQMTGTAEFNEVFFDDARTAAANVVGAPGDGWRVAIGHAGHRARRVHARPAGRVPPRASRTWPRRPGAAGRPATR